MSKASKKSEWALDIALHIPIPSIKIALTNTREKKDQNKPLQHNKKKEEETDHERAQSR